VVQHAANIAHRDLKVRFSSLLLLLLLAA